MTFKSHLVLYIMTIMEIEVQNIYAPQIQIDLLSPL